MKEESKTIKNNVSSSSLTKQEEEKIYAEMEQIIAQSNSAKRNKKRFDISSSPSGTKPLFIFNILLVLTVAASIATATTVINARSNKEELQILVLDSNQDILVEKILIQNKEKLNEKNKELESIQALLDDALRQQNNLEAVYNARVEAYQQELEQDIVAQVELLRKQLNEQNMKEADIDRQLLVLRNRLRSEYDEQLEAYKKEQAEEQLEKELAFNSQINDLQKEFQTNQSIIADLKADISKKEDELKEKNQQINSELNATQQKLAQITRDNNEKKLALEQFNIYHNGIATQIKNENFLEAKSSIKIAEEKIYASRFANDSEVQTHKDAYSIYTTMINIALTSQELIDKSDSEIKNLEQELGALQRVQQDSSTSADGKEKALRDQLQDLQRRYAALQAQATEDVQNAIGNTLFDIQLIIQYLNTKHKTGVADKKIVADLDREVYNNIIRLISNAIDPDGRLKF